MTPTTASPYRNSEQDMYPDADLERWRMDSEKEPESAALDEKEKELFEPDEGRQELPAPIEKAHLREMTGRNFF
jgi:hypothetical protein